MKDTPAYIQEKVCEMFSRKSGEERLKMGCSMHDSSKKLTADSLVRAHGDSA